jgi:sulfur-carrier protein adenylyltransferase/sulfurtransferase
VSFSNEEILRYSRHLIMPEVALAGQAKLKAGRVLCVGAGGLGSPVLLYLAAAGVGTLGVADDDVVDTTNLQRQVIHDTQWVGRPKVDSAVERIRGLNPLVEVPVYRERLTSENALDIISDYDLVVDGTDNFATRYLVNDACVLRRKPYVYASVFRFEGQASVLAAPAGPCYRCVFPEPPPPGMVPSCAEGGVLGVLPGLLGVIQATEAIKLILGAGESLVGRLLIVDALGMRFHELQLRKDPACPVCGEHPTVRSLIDYEEFCGVRGEETWGPEVPSIAPEELNRLLVQGADIVLLDVRDPHEYEISRLDAHRIPLGELPARVHELDSAREIVAYCKSGVRSARAIEFLRGCGFKRVRNLAGGINAWAERIDPSMPRY